MNSDVDYEKCVSGFQTKGSAFVWHALLAATNFNWERKVKTDRGRVRFVVQHYRTDRWNGGYGS